MKVSIIFVAASILASPVVAETAPNAMVINDGGSMDHADLPHSTSPDMWSICVRPESFDVSGINVGGEPFAADLASPLGWRCAR